MSEPKYGDEPVRKMEQERNDTAFAQLQKRVDYSPVAMEAILEAVRRDLDVEGQMRAALAAEHRDYLERCQPMIQVLTRIEMRTIRPIILPVDKPSQPPINHVAVTNILDRAHAALRTVDVDRGLHALGPTTTERVTNAVIAIEEFAREHGIKLTGG